MCRDGTRQGRADYVSIPAAGTSALPPLLDTDSLHFYTRFSHNERLRTALLAFMYPSCLAGALLALLMPSIVPGSVAVEDMFRAPLAYQYFLYHSALIVLGAYIPLSERLT